MSRARIGTIGIVSGICGIVRLDGQPVAPGDLDRMTRRLAHRGPDRVRAWRGGSAGLAHLMMRVTREDALDAQPLQDGPLTLAADVRLDNREELAAALGMSPEALAGCADSHLLLAAWTRWGADCVEHLLGDFAVAAWDAAQKTLTLVRDHMGQRHVYYHQGDGFFAFASEIKGLWSLPSVPRQLLEERIARRGGSVEPGTTQYEGIRALLGGTVLTLAADGTVGTRRYWEPRADPAHEGRDEAYYVRAYREVLGEAVACRLRRATAPGGLFMGGGFDTGAICALAGPAVTPNGLKLITVCSVMPEDYRGTIQHARPWTEACRRHMPHLDVRYVLRDGIDIFTDMERAFLATDGGHSPNGYTTRAMLAEIRAAGGRVVMDGFGGDYTINPRGKDALARLLVTGRLVRFVAEFRAMRQHLGQSVKQTLVRNVILPLLPRWVTQLRARLQHGLAPFGETMPFARPAGAPVKRRRGRRGFRDTLCNQQNGAAGGYSLSAAAHGLEFTAPFHDKRVVELGLAIPEKFWLKNGRTRHLAREALRGLYPPEFEDRRPGNDDMIPDFLAMAKRIEPRVLAEIDRMETAGDLSRYFDFLRMRRMLTRRTVDQHASGNEYDTRQALLTFMSARYVEWFRGRNR